MTTTQTARKRAADASPPNSQPKPRRRRQRISDLPRLRRLAADQIDRLIAFLDSTGPYVQTETEEAVDDAPCDDDELEPSLCGMTAGSSACGNDEDLEDEHDGAEPDHDREEVCEDEGAEHDGAEPDADGEPWLGWTTSGAWGLAATSYDGDREADGSYVTDAARQRYRPYDRWDTIRDGMHVDSERGFGAGSRRIRNLSGRQRGLVAPRLADGSGVSVSA